MKILRVLINSLLGGLFFSLLLSLLVADLNINFQPGLSFYTRITMFVAPLYGLVMTVLFFFLYFMIEFLFGRRARLKFISPSFLSLSFSFALLVFILLLKLNFSFYSSFFSSFTSRQLNLQLAAAGIMALTGLVVFWHFHRYQRRAIYFITYFLVFFLGLGFMFWTRWRFPQPTAPARLTILESFPVQKRATLVNLEGLTFDLLIPLVHAGKLPNFSWLMENGSWGRLKTLSPTDPPILEKSLFSGKNPYGHRFLSPFGFRLWGKEPVLEALPRFMLFKQLTRVNLLRVEAIPPRLQVKDISLILEEMKQKISLFKLAPTAAEEAVMSPKGEKVWVNFFPDATAADSRLAIVRQAFSHDLNLEERAYQEKTKNQPQVFFLRLNGLNQVETFFYKYSFPHLFGSLDQEEINRYGQVIEKYYQFYDQLLGKYLANLKEDETLVVFSTHGMEPLPLWKRLVEWILGNPQVSGHFEFAPDGVIFFYGQEIIRGQSLDQVRLIDIAPTLLCILGLPVARDMDGIVCNALFRPEFSVANPIFYIASYDEVAIKPAGR